MTAHLMSFARVALVLAISLMSMPLLRTAPAAARRLVLSAAFVFALALPFVPAWHVDAPAVQALIGRAVAEPAVAASGATGAQTGSIGATSAAIDWLVVAYAAGALAVFLRFAIGAVLAHRMVRRAVPITESADGEGLRAVARAAARVGRPVDVRMSTEIEAPAVTGIVAPVVLVPMSSRTWREARWESVLLHELAHVAAFDLAIQALASIACSLHWFNPLAWVAMRRLRLERELAADDAVLRAGTKASSYAQDLLAVAGAAHSGMIAIAEHPMKKRIAAIVAARRPAALDAKSAIALVAAAAAVSFGAACTTNEESPAPHTATATQAVDGELQVMAESELDRAVKQWNAAGGTILVLSPKGEILANAGGRSDRAYVAGSTMKPILLAAALEEGVVKDDEVFDCSGERGPSTMMDPGVFPGMKDSQPNGRLAVAEMLAVSSNIGFAQVFDRLGGARADCALRRFHFTPPAALATQPAGNWDGALTAIGATMTTTPLEVASAYAALADGGDGIVSASTALRVGGLLEGVVASERGTGKKARVDGVRAAGKTGTSSWTAKNGAETSYASFVGFVPADRPRYVIFVGIEGATGKKAWGGEVAAPVFSRLAARALAR